MYLSTLKLHGFKSFAEKTALEFAPGVTAIVGPNGCGKSNVVDAVRWVIGEQRPTALRSEKMENVIFNGTAGRRALGMAEVELVIENNRGVLPTEYTEVSIGRRLFRSGESEYLMNGQPCRLKDITGLFMDTGMGADAYSVIELKMIDEILSESAEDRRRLFEEAAGITKYKLRRRQSLRKLESAQADLARLRDRTDEIGKSVRRLKRQAARAADFKAYDTRLRALERDLAKAEHARLAQKRDALRAETSDLEQEAERIALRLSQEEKGLSVKRDTLAQREERLTAAREALSEHREAVRRLEAEERLQSERLEAARRSRDRLLREEEDARQRRAEEEKAQKRLARDLEQATPAKDEAEAALSGARQARDAARAAVEEKRTALRQLRRQVQEAEDKRTERQRALDRLASRLDLLSEDARRTEDRLAALQTDAGALAERAQEAARALEDAEAEAARARTDLENAEAEHRRLQAVLDEAAAERQRAERQRDAARAEVELLQSLVTSYEEFSGAVQFLAAEAEAWSAAAPLRTVADVLACDEAHRLALDAALGPLSACVVVETEAEAEADLARLREEEKGQAAFVVLDRLRETPTPRDAPPGQRPLRAAVRTADAAFAPLADVLLRDAFLADSLDEAQALAADAEPPARFYTREGEWADARGLVHGGHAQAGTASPVASRLGRREQLAGAEEQLARLEAALDEKRDAAEVQQETLAAVPLDAKRTALREVENVLADARQRHERAAYERETLSERRDELTQRRDALRQETETAKTQREEAQAEHATLNTTFEEKRAERDAAERAFQEAESAHQDAQDAFGEASVATVEARNRLDNLERDAARTEERLSDLAARAEARKKELEALWHTIETAQEEQTRLRESVESVRAGRTEREDAVSSADAALAETKKGITEAEDRLRALRHEREDTMRAENQRAIRLAEVKTRLEDLIANTREHFGLHLPDTEAPAEDFDERAARAEAADLRKQIEKLGSVNPLALEEYEEEKERLDFLQTQQDDLERAEATLLETIREINQTAARRFDETFGAIQENFGRLFERLFGEGAAAHLQLADPDDLLESDIEIVAQPRGKKPSVLTQLSSGEKALTAIALLFAIYLVKPSPFCILDEVDAPLDDANTGRFMQLIREFAGETQFILVTHNKHTMELADRMYGITMQEQGVSQLVGVSFEQAAEMASAA